MNYRKKTVFSRKIAEKALKEAEDRKNKIQKTIKAPKEIWGPSELEPTRFGDWERKGITSDFWVLFLEIYLLKW